MKNKHRFSSQISESLDLSFNSIEGLSGNRGCLGKDFFTDRSITMSDSFSITDHKMNKKKMGLQLSILESNILQEQNNSKARASKLNKSLSFIKKSKGMAAKMDPSPMTSVDLQQICRLDKDIYQLYLALLRDMKEESTREVQLEAKTEDLKKKLASQRSENQSLKNSIQEEEKKRLQLEQKINLTEKNYLRQMRQKLLE